MPTETYTLTVGTKVKGDLQAAMERIGKSTKGVVKSTDQLGKELKQIKPTSLNRLAAAAKKAGSGFLSMLKNATLFGTNLQGLVLIAVNKLRTSFVELTDQYNRVIGQMELYSGSAAKATELTHQLQDASIDTGWDLDALSSTMTKLGVGMEQFGQSEEELIDMTKGLGLVFRDMGADGDKLAKVAGNLATLFTRSTVPFEKLESLLGRGRHEQLFRGIGQELIKIKGIDLTEFGNRGKNAMQIIEREMKKGTVTGKDLHTALDNITKARLELGNVPTEIGHGWDQWVQSINTAITRIDKLFGGSNLIAKVFHDASVRVKTFTDWLTGSSKSMKAIKGLAYLIRDAFQKIVGHTSSWSSKLTEVVHKMTDNWYFKMRRKIIDAGKEGIDYLVDYFEKKKPKFNLFSNAAYGDPGAIGGGAGGGTAGGGDEGGGAGGGRASTQLSPAEGAIAGLINQMKNLDAAARISAIDQGKYADAMGSINAQAKNVLVTHAAEFESNDKLHNSLKGIIDSTNQYAKSAKKAKDEVDPFVQAQLKLAQDLKAAAQGAGKAAVDTVFDRGRAFERDAQGNVIRDESGVAKQKDLGPAGKIGQEALGDLASGKDPFLVAFETGLKVIVEILGQAAALSELFGKGLSAIFDPLNKLITVIAKSLVPIFNIFGSIMQYVGGVLDSVVSILEPIFELITAMLKPLMAVFQVLGVLGEIFGKIGKVVGGLIQKALKPLIWFYEKMAEMIIDAINLVIKGINKLIPGSRWDINEISLAGEREALQVDPTPNPNIDHGDGLASGAAQSPAEGAIKNLTDRIDALKTAAGKGWITTQQYQEQMANLNNQAKDNLVTHAVELASNKSLEMQLQKVIKATQKHADALRKEAMASDDATSNLEAELRARAEAAELEARIRAQEANHAVRVTEVGTISEARQRGIISGEQSRPIIKIVNVSDPDAVDARLASDAGEQVILNTMRLNSDEVAEVVS